MENVVLPTTHAIATIASLPAHMWPSPFYLYSSTVELPWQLWEFSVTPLATVEVFGDFEQPFLAAQRASSNGIGRSFC